MYLLVSEGREQYAPIGHRAVGVGAPGFLLQFAERGGFRLLAVADGLGVNSSTRALRYWRTRTRFPSAVTETIMTLGGVSVQ